MKLIHAIEVEVEELLAKQRKQPELLAEGLLKKETLEADEIRGLIRGE